MDWKTEAEQLKFHEGLSWNETSKAIWQKYFPNDPQEKIHEKNGVSNCLKGKSKTSYGYKWEYA